MGEIKPEIIEAWRRGATLFNAGKFWEAHEAWEFEWTRLPDGAKNAIQACILLCGALYHLQKNNKEAAGRLIDNARRKFEASTKELVHIAGFEKIILDLQAEVPRDDFSLESWLAKNPLRAEVRSV